MSILEQQLAQLQRFYGLVSAPPRDPFILYVWEVLGVRSAARQREAALAALRRIPALTPESMAKAPGARLEAAIALAGTHAEQRLQAIRTGVDLFRRTPRLAQVIRGPITSSRRALRRFPQLGEAGAHRMLLFAAGHAVLPVDERIHRVALRLGYGQPSHRFRRSSRSVRRALRAQLPASVPVLREAYLYLSHHGAATCTEGDPHCGVCPLREGCPEGRRRG